MPYLLIVIGVALYLIEPIYLVAFIVCGVLYLFLSDFDFGRLPILPKNQRNKFAIKRLRTASTKSQNYAAGRRGRLYRPQKKRGYVYACAQRKIFGLNPHVDRADYYDGNAMKIGFTTGNPYQRSKEISKEYNTRIFEPAVIADVNWSYEIEQEVHKLLSTKWLWREMFDVTPEEAEQAIYQAIENTEGAILNKLEIFSPRSEEFENGGIYNQANSKSDAADEIPF